MKQIQHIMGMPITLICADESIDETVFDEVFAFFTQIDKKYSPYIETSEVTLINQTSPDKRIYSKELTQILALADATTEQTHGYFNVWHNGVFDPSGIVKGWAIHEAAKLLAKHTDNFYVEAGGDIEVSGHSPKGNPWMIGVRNPFDRTENISVIHLDHGAIATSGTAIRGRHIYNPLDEHDVLENVSSLSVIATNIVDADRMATAAFAMGKAGIEFIESLDGHEGYMVTSDKQVTMTSLWHTFESEQS
jgi:thiamine biosynthesis lipoprotein